MPLRAVLFDLDGTLWGDGPGWKGDEADFARLTELEARRLAPAFDAAGVGIDPLEFASEFWAFLRRREEEVAAENRAVNGPALVAEMLEARGVRAGAPAVRAAWEALDIPAAEYGRALFPDTAATLEAIRQSGVLAAVVSNRVSGSDVLRADFDELGIGHHFGPIVCSGHVGWRKPHPAVFEAALRELGVGPRQALVVGDSFENDVRGARALGITAVLKLNGREPTAEEGHESDHLIHNLSDLLDLGLF